MDLSSAIASVNLWAALVAALASFAVGGLWYSPLLFFRPWAHAAGLTEEQLNSRNMPLVFSAALLLQLIVAFVLAMFVGRESDLRFGLSAALLVGVGWVAPTLGVLYLFERRPLALFGINAGYAIAAFAVMGAIIGSWH